MKMGATVTGLAAAMLLCACGCAKPFGFHGSRLQRELARWTDEEVVELTYLWRALGGLPRKYEQGHGRYRDVETWLVTENVNDPQLDVCLRVRPETVGWLTSLHPGLVADGFHLDRQQAWSYKPPPGLRERADELGAQVTRALTSALKERLPGVPVSPGPALSSELYRHVWFAFEPIRPDSPRRLQELLPAAGGPAASVDRPGGRYPVLWLRLGHVFPTLGRSFVLGAALLTEAEAADIPRIVRTALKPLIELDPRHYARPK